ncbi:MAG: S-layer homology domain-containing protein [Oscillospiraceae bacterium]|nr:S-layer homology domain-containing protein [Oscillospiraceae bacterium]
MKKTIAVFALVFALLLPTPAFAAGSTDNYTRTKTYSNQFSDVSSSSIFYSNIAALYEYGLSVGKGGGLFGINDSVTVGQAATFAARIRSLYETGDAEAGASQYSESGGAWYTPYFLYLENEDVIGTELDSAAAKPATRAQVAHILANTLPDDALPDTNASAVNEGYATGKFITDVTSSTEYSSDIVELYRLGVSNGNDSTGNFYPADTITRGELSAMLTRMIDPTLRVTIKWDVAAAMSAAGTTFGDLVFEDTTYTAAPTTEAEVLGDVNNMLAAEKSTLLLKYNSRITRDFISSLMQLALECVQRSSEQCYNSVDASWSEYSGIVNLTFYSSNATSDQTSAYRSYTLASAIAVHDELWENGSITSDMTDMQKARVYFDWICKNCSYSDSDGEICHLPYSLFKNGRAVCDGYTGAYNLLLKLEGIECYTLTNDDHAWTVATLDGTDYHIDTTWGDQVSYINYSFFAMSEQTSRNYHNW